MEDVILLGNGINNLSKNRKTWDELLEDIITLCGNGVRSEDKSLPILYEEVFLKAARINNKSERILKEEIAKILDTIDSNSLHDKLLQLNIKEIITTNYDRTLQNSLLKNGSQITGENKSENEFNIFRYTETSHKRIWHVHGIVSKPQSIILGFDHYCRQTSKIESYLTGKYAGKFQESFKDRFLKNKVSDDSWIDLFFTANIHIIGLNFGFEETDLWWLLTKRARLKVKNELNYSNKIVYYLPKKYENAIKEDMFDAVDVKVLKFDSKDQAYYTEVIDHIQRQLIKTPQISLVS